MTVDQIVCLIFGSVLLLGVATFAIIVPYPSPVQYTVFRILLALGCACVAVFVSGFLKVKISDNIKAGGALGIFVVVYFFAPAAVPNIATFPRLLSTFDNLRAVDPKNPNQDDLSRAIGAVNEAGTLIREDPRMRKPFASARGQDFQVLYDTLTKHKIPVPHMNSTSDQLVTSAAHELARSLTA